MQNIHISPLILLTLLFVGNQTKHTGFPHNSTASIKQFSQIVPPYFDTFQMELMIDKLNDAVGVLEKINKINQLSMEPFTSKNTVHKIKQSVDSLKEIVPEGHIYDKLDSVSSVINTFSQFGNIQNLTKTLSPMLKMLSNPEILNGFAQNDSEDSSLDMD